MTDAGLTAAVRECVAALLDVALLPGADDATLADIAPERYDSLGVLDCVGMIEQRFGVSIDLVEDDLRTTFRSVTAITALVERKLRDAAVLGLLA
jgi:acyl carrier protein